SSREITGVLNYIADMVIQERLGLGDHLTDLLVGARHCSVRGPALARGPAECAGDAGIVPIGLHKAILAVFGDQQVGSEVAVFKGDLHLGVPCWSSCASDQQGTNTLK